MVTRGAPHGVSSTLVTLGARGLLVLRGPSVDQRGAVGMGPNLGPYTRGAVFRTGLRSLSRQVCVCTLYKCIRAVPLLGQRRRHSRALAGWPWNTNIMFNNEMPTPLEEVGLVR